MKKRWIILIVLVLLIAFGWFNFFVPHGSARKKLAEYKKELIAKGEKLDMASFAPLRKENANNGANAFLTAVGNWRNLNSFTLIMTMVAPGAAMIGHTNLDALSRSNYEVNVSHARKVRATLTCDTLDFVPNYSTISPTLLPPNLRAVKSAALLFSQTAIQALDNNDLPEAASDLGAQVDMLQLWVPEPIGVMNLVRNTCLTGSIRTIWEALQQDGWADEQLAGLQHKWERLDIFNSLERAIAGERVLISIGMAESRLATNAYQLDETAIMNGTKPPTVGEWWGSFTDDPKTALKDAYDRYPRFWLWKSKWSYDEELFNLESASAVLAAIRELKTSGACVPVIKKMSLQLWNYVLRHADVGDHLMVFSGHDGVSLSRDVIRTAQMEAARRLLVTAIALKRFKQRNGIWPEKLDELVPEFLDKLPIDFMDGKPLRYRRVDGGTYLLYSVGVDGIDDGGNPAPPPNEPNLVRFTEMRDIVWPQPATEQQIKDYLDREAKRTNAPAALPPPAEK